MPLYEYNIGVIHAEASVLKRVSAVGGILNLPLQVTMLDTSSLYNPFEVSNFISQFNAV